MANRRLQVVLAVVVAVAGVGTYLAYRLRIDDLKELLVVEANQVVGARRTRPTHVDHATPGSFGDALNLHLPAVEQGTKDLPHENDRRDALRRIIDGERPLSETPPAYLTAAAQLRPHIDAVLAATHAEAADLSTTKDCFMPANDASWIGVHVTATLAGLRLRQALAEGHAAGAMDLCLDTLGLGRDVTVAGGLLGLEAGRSVIRRVSLACVAAIQAQPGEALAQVPTRLRRIREAIPSVERIAREESVQMQLIAYGSLLSSTQIDGLQARPRLFTKCVGPTPKEDSFLSRLARRTFWREGRELSASVIKAAKQRPDVRDALLKSLADGVDRKPVWMREFLPQPQTFLRLARRADSGLLRLDLLLTVAAAQAYRETKGEWPKNVDALVEAGGLTSEEGDRMVSAMMGLRPGENGGLEITLPQPNDRGPSELIVRLAAP